jgi:GT2 family glycosyltransferase
VPGADPRPPAALVITYKARSVIADTLRSLLAQSPRPDPIVVVDNASPDGTADAVMAEFPDVDVLRVPTNRGYAAAFNLGVARVADADTVLVVTHDTVLAPGALEILSTTLRTAPPTVAAVGPLLGVRRSRDLVWSAGGTLDRRKWDPGHTGSGESVSDWESRPPHRVEWLDGACILFRNEVLAALGPMDESYFLYYEELDYFTALNAAGYESLCAPGAVAHQQPANAPPYLMTRNRLRLASRWGGRGAVARVISDLVIDECRRTVRRRAEGRTQSVLGLTHFLLGRQGPPPAHIPLVPSSELLDP